MDVEKKLRSHYNTFWRLIKSKYYFDKSKLIEEIINCEGEAFSITAPTGFFKGSNNTMLRTFFDIDIEQKREENERRKVLRKELFKNLRISQSPTVIEEYIGQCPVININFKQTGKDYGIFNFNCDTCWALKSIVMVLRTDIRKIFKRISRCRDKEIFSPSEHQEIEHFVKDLLTEDDLKVALKVASRLLTRYFGKKTFVFIENYDYYVTCSMTHHHRCTRILTEFFSTMFQNLVADENVFCLLLTSETSIFKVPNVNEYPFLEDHKFSEFYGITEQDVSKCNAADPELRELMDKCYNVKGCKRKIHSPWSLTNIYEGYYGTFRSLIRALRFHPVFDVPQIKTKVQILLDCSMVNLCLKSRFEENDLYILQDLLLFDDKVCEAHVNVFFTFLYEHGLLTEAQDQNGKIRERFGFQVCTLYKIANDQAFVCLASLTSDVYNSQTDYE